MKKTRIFWVLLLSFSCFLPVLYSFGTPLQKTVYLIPVKGTVDLGLSAFIHRAVAEARNNQAECIIFDIDTFGGRIDAANEIVSVIQDIAPVPTYAYISNTAWSAGALIALSCKTIFVEKIKEA